MGTGYCAAEGRRSNRRNAGQHAARFASVLLLTMITSTTFVSPARTQQLVAQRDEKLSLSLGGFYIAAYTFGDEARGQKPCPIRNAGTGVTVGCSDPLAGGLNTLAGGLGTATPFGGSVNEAGRGKRQHGTYKKGEVHFRGRTTLDNGLTVGVQVELEAVTFADQIDKSNIFFSGSFGRVEYGGRDGVAEQMYYGAPFALLQYSTVIRGIGTPFYSAGFHSVVYPQVGPGFTTFGDWDGINYYTPRIAGLQLGITYKPEICEGGNPAGGVLGTPFPLTRGIVLGVNAVGPIGGGGCPGGATSAINSGQQGDIATLSANYVNKFDQVNVGTAVFWSKGHLEGPTGLGTANGTLLTDRNELGFGLNVSAHGVTFGGGWRRDNIGVRSNNTDRVDFNLGIRYRTGPWQFGLEYGHGRQGQGIAPAGVQATEGTRAGSDIAEVLISGLMYTVSPGVRFYAGLLHFNLEDNFRNPAHENSGFVGVIGTWLDF